MEFLKGKPDPTAAKHVIPAAIAVGGEEEYHRHGRCRAEAHPRRATEGILAVLFTVTRGDYNPGGAVKGVGHAYIDNYWYTLSYDREGKCWVAFKSELGLLTRYCGPADKFGDLGSARSLRRGGRGAGHDRRQLGMYSCNAEPKVQDLRASLQRLDNPNKQGRGAASPTRTGNDNPLTVVGTVKVLSDDGKSFTLLPEPPAKGKEPTAICHSHQ